MNEEQKQRYVELYKRLKAYNLSEEEIVELALAALEIEVSRLDALNI